MHFNNTLLNKNRHSIHHFPFIASIFLGRTAESLLIFAVPLIVLHNTGSPSKAGFTFMLEWLPAVCMYPVCGIIVDKLGPKKCIALSSLIRGAIIGLTLLIIIMYVEYTVYAINACALISSIFMPFNRIGAEKFISLNATHEVVHKLHSKVQLSEILAWTLGPALAGFAAIYVELTDVLLLSAVLFVFSAISIKTAINNFVAQAARREQKLSKDLMFGVKYIFQSKKLLKLAASVSLFNFVFALVMSSNASIIIKTLSMDEYYYGLLNLLAGISSAVNLILAPTVYRLLGQARFGLLGLLFGMLGFISLSMSTSFLALLVSFSASMIGVGWFNLFNKTLRTHLIEKEVVGKVMGAFYLFNMAMIPAGGGVIYLTADTLGNQLVIFVSALTSAAVILFLMAGSESRTR